MSETFDFLVVGGGVVGLTLARELRRRHPKASIAVLEKEPALGRHASGRNSGVLHSGIYYPPNTLKAKVCVSGAARLRAYAEERKLPMKKTGKLILATEEKELPALERLMENARANGVRAERLDAAGVRAAEPGAFPDFGGIFSPDTAVIDVHAVLESLAGDLKAGGVALRLATRAARVDPRRKTVDAWDAFSFGFLFNCAGAYADDIARQMGHAAGLALVPFKGTYFELSPAADGLVKGSIYPVPDPAFPFLGVHFTRGVSGHVYAGPTAIPALGRENYSGLEGVRLGEAAEVAWQTLALYLGNRHNFRGLVHNELSKYGRDAFAKAARRLVPALKDEDLTPCGKVGIRPQLVNLKERKLELDFVVERDAISMHVLNAISPAFTSSLAFAEYLADRFEGKNV
jgi:(S)-2-hydroxyglutarate dehydrogenase